MLISLLEMGLLLAREAMIVGAFYGGLLMKRTVHQEVNAWLAIASIVAMGILPYFGKSSLDATLQLGIAAIVFAIMSR